MPCCDIDSCQLWCRLHNIKKIAPAQDPKYMLQVISSAIVNTPPPPPVILMVTTLGKKRHKVSLDRLPMCDPSDDNHFRILAVQTLHYIDTDEDLLEMFPKDVRIIAEIVQMRNAGDADISTCRPTVPTPRARLSWVAATTALSTISRRQASSTFRSRSRFLRAVARPRVTPFVLRLLSGERVICC